MIVQAAKNAAELYGASNLIELAVTVAISLFGATSPVALATIVGVHVEIKQYE